MIGGYIGGIGTVTYVESGTTAYVTVTEDADTLTSAAIAILDCTEEDDTLTATISHSGFGSRIASARPSGAPRNMAHIGGRAGLNASARGGTRIRAA